MGAKSEQAVQLFRNGFNCSQSVLAVFCEKYGLSSELALKAACGFGGGMRCGEICGAVSGAVLVIGLKYGQYSADDQESKKTCYSETVKFTSLFKETNGSIICHDLLGCDISTEKGMKEAQSKGLFTTTCIDMVVSAVNLLESLGY
jgi:C_GCAxxG_C_C family probable redox protein